MYEEIQWGENYNFMPLSYAELCCDYNYIIIINLKTKFLR